MRAATDISLRSDCSLYKQQKHATGRWGRCEGWGVLLAGLDGGEARQKALWGLDRVAVCAWF